MLVGWKFSVLFGDNPWLYAILRRQNVVLPTKKSVTPTFSQENFQDVLPSRQIFVRGREELSDLARADLDLGLCRPWRGEDDLQRRKSGCQKIIRRSLVQLQQVGEAGRQHDRPAYGPNQAQALTAHRCGKCHVNNDANGGGGFRIIIDHH